MLRILHVERSELIRKVMRELVTRCGHSVVGVSSKADALAHLASGDVDLIVTGVELDDGDAEDLLCEMASDRSQGVPVIVVTSHDSLEQRERLFSLGVVDYMLKGEFCEERFRRYFDSLAAEDELSSFMRSLRVAVLDDSMVILKIVSHILSMNGFASVRLFANPLELFDSGEHFDLYITDIVLPNMSGEQVVSRLRTEVPDSIIISMSKFTGEKPLANILLAGADDYIHKPFDAAGLISRLKVNARSYLLKKRLERMAVTDSLTELYNHRYSYERLEEEVSKAERYGRPLSIAMIDIDDFKRVNDERGHRAGDEVLAAVAKAIRGSLRSVDVVGRYGGEEFIVIFPESGLEAAKVAAEKIRLSVEALRPCAGTLRVSVSLGLAEHRASEGAGALVSRADEQMYCAKRTGKNRVVC